MPDVIRFAQIILLFTFLSCHKSADQKTLNRCEYEREEALADYEKGVLRFINWQGTLRYEMELKALLKQKGMEYRIAGPHGDEQCYGSVMDSLITLKFGGDFIEKLNLEADSLFYEKKKDSTFSYWEVDTWALRKDSDHYPGGDFIINYLNDKLKSDQPFRFVSNTVGRPHYVIAFTVDKNGDTKDVEIKERSNTEKFNGKEELILREVTKIKGWIPATIRNKPVTAWFQMGVAMENR